MDNRMPSYLGKVITPDNPSRLSKFAMNKYDSFSKIYHKCKDESDNISDIKYVDDDDDTAQCSIRLCTSQETLDRIGQAIADDDNIYIDRDVIIAKR